MTKFGWIINYVEGGPSSSLNNRVRIHSIAEGKGKKKELIRIEINNLI